MWMCQLGNVMRLLASNDFALRALMLLAREPAGKRMSVESLAQELGDLSRNHLHKIVQELTSLGITHTPRGTGGACRWRCGRRRCGSERWCGVWKRTNRSSNASAMKGARAP
jgi:hypothetical protein